VAVGAVNGALGPAAKATTAATSTTTWTALGTAPAIDEDGGGHTCGVPNAAASASFTRPPTSRTRRRNPASAEWWWWAQRTGRPGHEVVWHPGRPTRTKQNSAGVSVSHS